MRRTLGNGDLHVMIPFLNPLLKETFPAVRIFLLSRNVGFFCFGVFFRRGWEKGWEVLWVQHFLKLSSQMSARGSEIIEISPQKEPDNFIKTQ